MLKIYAPEKERELLSLGGPEAAEKFKGVVILGVVEDSESEFWGFKVRQIVGQGKQRRYQDFVIWIQGDEEGNYPGVGMLQVLEQ